MDKLRVRLAVFGIHLMTLKDIFESTSVEGSKDIRHSCLNDIFFFSSRRRHTRSQCDWSSDVCSSDRSEEHTSELQSHSDLVCRLLLDWSSDVCSSDRSEEHTSELQSHCDLVCRLLLGNKHTQHITAI